MKKYMVVLITIVVILSCVSCTSSKPKDDKGTSNVVTDERNNLTVFESFEKVLNDKGLTYEKVTMAAEMVGAQQGIKYKMGDSKVEIYRFDTSTNVYKDAEESQSLQLDGIGSFEAVVKNGYAILSDDQEMIDAFLKIVTN